MWPIVELTTDNCEKNIMIDKYIYNFKNYSQSKLLTTSQALDTTGGT